MRFLAGSRVARSVLAAVLLAGGVWAYAAATRDSAPDVALAVVTRGDYVDLVETRGDIRPLRSIAINAPYQAGDLQILKLAANGAAVKKGDVVAELDALTIQRTIQDKEGELQQAQAERDQASAQAHLDEDKTGTGLMTANHDVDRAKLDVVDEDFVSKSDTEKARLALADTQTKLSEAETRDRAGRDTDSADAGIRARKIAKIQADIDRATASLQALKLVAPADGTVNILQNWRNASPTGSAQEFHEGDHIWPGATIMELPDLSAVHLASHIDETDRGQLKVGQSASVRVDAVPDREYHGVVSDVSILARVDYSTGWPPTKNFDLTLALRDPDDRLKPGMSASARIDVGHVPNVLLVPAGAVFTIDGRPVVFRLAGRQFDAVPVEIIRRGREQAAVTGALAPGDHVALTRPDQPKKTGTR